MSYTVLTRSRDVLREYTCDACAGGECECIHDALERARAHGGGASVWRGDVLIAAVARRDEHGTSAIMRARGLQ